MGWVPDGIIGIFCSYNPSSHTMAPGIGSFSQKWVPGMSPGVKGGGCIGLTALLPSCANCDLNLLEPYGPVKACNGIVLPLPFTLPFGSRIIFFNFITPCI